MHKNELVKLEKVVKELRKLQGLESLSETNRSELVENAKELMRFIVDFFQICSTTQSHKKQIIDST